MTELERAEVARARLAAIVESSEEAIIAIGNDGVITDWNEAATRLYGYSGEEAVGRNITTIVPPSRADELREIQNTLAAGGRICQLETVRLRKDGSPVDVSLSIAPIVDRDGAVIGCAGITRDITSRKRMEEALRQSEERFRLVTQATKDIIWDWDVKSGRTWRSEIYWEHFGYLPKDTEPDIAGWRDLLHPEDRDRVWNSFQRALLRQADSYEVEYRFRRADDSYAVVLDRAFIVYDETGQPTRSIGALTDLSERRYWEEQFRQVVEGAPMGIYIKTDGIFRYFNRAALAMFGAESADQIVGQHFLQRIHPDSRSAVIDRAHLVTGEKKAVPFLEVRLLRLDGTDFDAEVTAIPFTFEQRVGAIVFVRDITERKRAEVERRDLELQLRQAQKMEAVGQLAGAVAHDFNNLLMGISSQAELLMKTPDPRQAGERARAILSAVESAGELTKKILAFSRKQELATSTFDLNQLVAETNEFIGRLLPESISVDARLSAAPCWVNADRVQMEQTLINLVLNARDAMPGGGKLVLSACHIDIDADDDLGLHDGVPSGAYALISVADTGHGIPEHHLEKIFEPFFTTKPKERGTGLGLSIAYGIVSQSGGHIRVKSTVGAGTTFTIYIPSVERPQAEPPNLNLNPCPLKISEASCPQEGTVLVVDDEAIVRKSIRAYLELNGLAVFDCADASEALKVASELKDKLALLITDVVMPNMTGIELARALVKQMPGLPIIFMSGYAAGEKGHEEFRQAKFLQKPFACATLLDTVCEGLHIFPRQGKMPN